jgi:rRNA methylases
MEVLRSEQLPDRILMQSNIAGESVGDIIRLAKQKGVPITRVPVEKLNRITRSAHQGVIAFGAVVNYIPLQDRISQLYDLGKVPFMILLDGITDVRNVGAIIRSAVCCGADTIIFTEKNAAPIHEDMIKTSAGALTQISFCREKNMESIYQTLQMNGIVSFSSDLNAEKSLLALDFRGIL